MTKIWSGIIVVTILPMFVFAHFLLWPPCKENEDTILEPGFLIYSKTNYKSSESDNTLDINLFLRDCRFRTLTPYTVQNNTIAKGTYLASDELSMTDVELFVKYCSRFETIPFHDDDYDFVFDALMDYGTIPEYPKDCVNHKKRKSFLDGVRDINLSRNQIYLMDDPVIFASLINLQTLNLASNHIDNMHEDIFKTLTQIKNLTLSHNRIKTFHGTLFQDLSQLEEIDLSYNLIEYMPAHAFRGTALEKLNLSYNKLKYLPMNFFQDLESVGAGLKSFYFDCNPWYCGCLKDILVELKELNVNYNLDSFNGVNPVCYLEKSKTFECDRHLDTEYESNQCLILGNKLLEDEKS